MKTKWLAGLGLALAVCLGTGCDDGGASDENAGYHPAFDASGDWSVQVDGAALGVINLTVSAIGKVGGTLTTLQGAVAQLDGAMDGYGTEFSVTFPAEHYLAALTFTADGQAATGALIEDDGSRQTLRLDRLFYAL